LEDSPVHRSKTFLVGGILTVSAILAACSSSGATTAPAATAAPAASTAAASTAPASGGAAAGGSTIMTATVGSNGTLIVAGSNSMTVYTFSKDTAGSGTSACTAACITKWPALTVPAGTTPTVGAGATGKIGTITRTDSNGALQVTYNGLPLYFFSGDKAVGDSNGIYTNWSGVKP
jgi:predicted lipoprotein with Yx(FWY)xxD motif